MKMRLSGRFVLVTTLGLAAAIPSLAQQDALPAGFTTEPILKTSMTRDNEPIVYPTVIPPARRRSFRS